MPDGTAVRWAISGTVASNRRNLFDLTPGREHQVATLVAGSRTKLSRFERELAIIEAAPLMLQYLREVIALAGSIPRTGDRSPDDLRQRIESLVGRL